MSHLSFSIKGQTGHSVGVDVPKDGHRLHPIRVPDTDEWVFTHLTSCHLDLVWVYGQAETQTGENQMFTQ